MSPPPPPQTATPASAVNVQQQGNASRRISQSGAESTATHLTAGSNAFEGALDGLDLGLDSFGLDPSMPFSNDLFETGFPPMEI
jgi:hypothetical protein